MQTKTIRVRKTTVFFLIVFILAFILVTGVVNSYTKIAEEQSMAQTPAPSAAEDYSGMELIQLRDPSADAEKAVISTSAGEFTVVLYSEKAPEAVRRFRSECENGSFNGMKAGIYDLKSVFTLDSPSEEPYSAELSIDLWPFKGAVCMTEKGDIVFINTIELTDEEKAYLKNDDSELKEVSAAFADIGGVPNYARVYAVFGQIIDGMDIAERICSSGDEAVIVESVSFTK